MYNHASADYICPICLGVNGIENNDTLLKQSDVIYKDGLVTAFINSFFIPGNEGHIIVVPNKHFENLYDLPNDYAYALADISKKIALVLKKTYKCEGITLVQNNEPAGNQHAFHYHQHVFPRYTTDTFYKEILNKQFASQEERLKFVQKIKKTLRS